MLLHPANEGKKAPMFSWLVFDQWSLFRGCQAATLNSSGSRWPTSLLLVPLRQCPTEGGNGQAQKRAEIRGVLGREDWCGGLSPQAGLAALGFVACRDFAPVKTARHRGHTQAAGSESKDKGGRHNNRKVIRICLYVPKNVWLISPN